MKQLLFTTHFISMLLSYLLISNSVVSQVSIHLGTSSLKRFVSNNSSDRAFIGLNGGIELPRSNDVTFYGRIGYYFPRKEGEQGSTFVTATNFNTTPYNLTINYQTKLSYTTIEGGTRYYLGNDYDNGFSLYGGGNFMLNFISVKRDYDKQDVSGEYEWENNYQLSPSELRTGKIISIAMGLQGGLKYTIPATGTFYFDVSGHYSIFGQPSNANISQQYYSPIFFLINLGYRKDLY
jgi:hypothetical protein